MQLKDFIGKVANSAMIQTLGSYPALASFVEEFESLKKVTDVAAQGDDFAISKDVIESLKGARQMILNKKSHLYESLTLFPVGLFVQQSCNMAIEAVCRDVGFASDLDTCMSVCSALKTFTPDILVKPDSYDIVVPGQAKVVEIVQKLQLIEAAASNHFKSEKATAITCVESKIKELATALLQVSTDKFQKVCLSEDFKLGLQSLLAGKLAPEAAVRLTEHLTACKNFVPASQSLLQKTLGAQAKSILDKFVSLRNFFGTLVAALPHIMNLIEDVATKAGQFQFQSAFAGRDCEAGRIVGQRVRRDVYEGAAWRRLRRSDRRVDGGDRQGFYASWLQICCDDMVCFGMIPVMDD